jgi:hypothetical protein
VASVPTDVTVNDVEAELEPSSVALTICCPIVESGIVKLAKNIPLVSVSTGSGVVSTSVPLNFILMDELGSNPAPAISTWVLTGPEDGSINMTGLSGGVGSL